MNFKVNVFVGVEKQIRLRFVTDVELIFCVTIDDTKNCKSNAMIDKQNLELKSNQI